AISPPEPPRYPARFLGSVCYVIARPTLSMPDQPKSCAKPEESASHNNKRWTGKVNHGHYTLTFNQGVAGSNPAGLTIGGEHGDGGTLSHEDTANADRNSRGDRWSRRDPTA